MFWQLNCQKSLSSCWGLCFRCSSAGSLSLIPKFGLSLLLFLPPKTSFPPAVSLCCDALCCSPAQKTTFRETGQDLQGQILWDPTVGTEAVAESLGEGAIFFSPGLRFFPDGIICALVALFPSLRVLTLVSWPRARLNDCFRLPLFPPAAFTRGRRGALFCRAAACAF